MFYTFTYQYIGTVVDW